MEESNLGFVIDDNQYEYLDGLPEPNYVLRRFMSPSQGHRYYYELIGGKTVLYSSLTTMIGRAYPDESDALMIWKIKMKLEGKDPDAYAAYRADYGTLMHIIFAHYIMGREVPMSLKQFREYVLTIPDIGMPLKRIEEVLKNDTEALIKDLLSFAQFCQDYNVKALGIELMLRHYGWRVATPIDLICEMDYEVLGYHGEVYKTNSGENKKGDPKLTKNKIRVRAILDFKSGRKGFYDKHALQLGIGKIIFEENYPNMKIDALFNFSPKDWRTSPTYNLKEQTDNQVMEEMEEVLVIGKRRFLKDSPKFTSFKGVLNRKEYFDYSKHYNNELVEDFLNRVHKSKDGSTKANKTTKAKNTKV